MNSNALETLVPAPQAKRWKATPRRTGTTLATQPPEDFVRAVRSALRRFHETGRLLSSPLLCTAHLRELRIDQRVEQLRTVVREGTQRLADNARTQSYHRALHHTFLDPAPTQLLAAERCRMSFGTYRRHLQAGIEHIAAELWLRLGQSENNDSAAFASQT